MPDRAARRAVLRQSIWRLIRAAATADLAELERLGAALRSAMNLLKHLEGR